MPDSSSQEPSKEEETPESVDLSALQSFSFGTQWTEAPKSSQSVGKTRGGGRGGPRGGDRPDRRKGGAPARKDRRPARPPRGDFSGGEAGASQEDGQGRHGGGNRRFQRGQGHGGQSKPMFRPYESTDFDICFYPEDNCFSAIIKAMRANHTTYELFHVAKLFLEKTDRFIASVTRKAEKGEKPERVFISLVDNMPFVSEEEAISHAIAYHAEHYFTIEEVEVEPPSGNFTFVNRCPFTKELLGPPNYHKYEETLRNHHRTRLPNMAFEKLQSSIETVREEEVVAQWLESQKKATRYTAKEIAEGEEAKVFDSIDDAIGYLRTNLKAKVVKQVNYARVTGTILEKFQETEAFKAMDGERQRQLRFPLDTANAIRGRMRREKFSIYKKGSKGVTYVCATKRNFRTPGQVMSPELDRLIAFLEKNQMIKAKELSESFGSWLKEAEPEVTFDEKKLQRDLHWLIADGYVSHFEDDALFVQPILEAGASEDHPKEAKPKKKAEVAAVAVEAPDPGTEAPVEVPETESPAASAESEVEPEAEAAEAKAETEATDVSDATSDSAADGALKTEESATPPVEETADEPVADEPAEAIAPPPAEAKSEPKVEGAVVAEPETTEDNAETEKKDA